MEDKLGKLKSFLFMLAIVIVYLPFVHLALTTFVGENPMYPETKPCAVPAVEKLAVEQQRLSDAEQQKCWDAQEGVRKQYEEQRKVLNTKKYLISVLISLLTLIAVLFIVMEPVISYGLFFSAVLNVLVSLTYDTGKTYLGVLTLFLLLVGTVVFIQKALKGSSPKKASKR
ncbi:MAG TPA: hypothetical protein VJG90_04410 [Candidatus Nanoarchaeia archaeon]|nr:hypothetical protein [Candidatus Nanoarchaeia archaeon]